MFHAKRGKTDRKEKDDRDTEKREGEKGKIQPALKGLSMYIRSKFLDS